MEVKLKTSEKKKNTKNIMLTITVPLVFTAAAIGVIYSPGTYGNQLTQSTAVPATITGDSGCSRSIHYKDISRATIFTTQFFANWTFPWNTGNPVTHYSPVFRAANANWNLLGWIHLGQPQWANTNTNTWVAYGKGQYLLGIRYLSITQDIYNEVSTGPGSYASALTSGGYGSARS